MILLSGSAIDSIICEKLQKSYCYFTAAAGTENARRDRSHPGAVSGIKSERNSALAEAVGAERKRACGTFSASTAGGYAAEDSRRKQAKSKSRTSRSRPGFVSSKNLKEIQRLLNCGARRAAFKPYFFLSFILGSRVRKPAAFNVARNSGLTLRRARATP